MAPKDWETRALSALLREPIRNGYSPNCPDEPNGSWVLSLGAVTERGFNVNGVKPAPPGDEKVARFRLVPGDIVVSRSNSRERVGLAGLYRGEPPKASFPDLMMRLRVDPSVADARFVLAALLSPAGRKYFEANARGTSASMVKVDRTILADFPVPVPSLVEQRRIVDVLQAADDAVAAATDVRTAIEHTSECLRQDAFASLLSREVMHLPFGQIVGQVREEVAVADTTLYTEIGLRSHGRGVFQKPPRTGAAIGAKRVFRVHPGLLVFNIVFAWEGAVGVTGVADADTIASHRFPMFRARPDIVDVRYLRHFFRSKAGRHLLGVLSPGGAGRNKTLNQGDLLRTPIPLAPLNEQIALADAMDAVEAAVVANIKSLNSLERVRLGLLNDLTSGRVRVPA